ncbi:STAS domain-containing protein [Xanthomonadaceae bacterium JHOS43]|nr:STAS domain-containing protein [Xanthomonadaceae bacterium JHOS43]MCX7562713.1 STAS domain-containing protein [Xanthomonadaceae bacterium XH05]
MSQCSTRIDGDTATVLLGGEIDLSWSAQVRREVLNALERAPKVAIDLSQVGYIDSSGIAALVEGFQNARGRGQPFELSAISPSVLAVLKLARLDRVFPIRGMEAG